MRPNSHVSGFGDGNLVDIRRIRTLVPKNKKHFFLPISVFLWGGWVREGCSWIMGVLALKPPIGAANEIL